jgi:GTP-binding protein
LIAFNKIDLLTRKEKDEMYNTKRALSNFLQDFIKLEISGIKGTGFKRLFRNLDQLITKSQQKYSTSQLNKLLEKFVNQSSPPSIGGRQLKLRYVHFAGINPTSFVIHSNNDKKYQVTISGILKILTEKNLNLKVSN